MKKLTMICMSALLMLAVSCKKDKKTEIENAGSGFRATVESHEGTGKTHLDDLAVKWNSGDAILVKSSTCTTPKRFTTTGTDASASFDAAESLDEDFYTPDYTAYYPGLENNPAGVYFSDDQLTLPATQNYVENTFASGANPMAATSSDNVLPFKNVCGVLKLQLYSTTACQVQSISITSNTGEKLCGTGTVTLTGGIPALGELSNSGSTLTLAMGEGGQTMSTSDSQPTAYYFVVPVGTLGTSFTVKVTDTDGNVWTKTANAPANSIVRSQITKMPKLAVETKPGIPEGALPGLFTVSDNGTPDNPTDDIKVYFSKGNLQYTTTGTHSVAGGGTAPGTWRFAEHQFDFVGDATNGNVYKDDVKCNNANASSTYEGWIDLFGWGTSGWDNNNNYYQPYNTGKSSESVAYGYGPTDGSSYKFSLTGDYANADWGVNCAISNGGNQAGKWRTLTEGEKGYGEWDYLLYTRTMTNDKDRFTNKYNGIDINGITYKGLFIYPDDYNGSVVGEDETTDTWDKINDLGIVFLPSAGSRNGTTVGFLEDDLAMGSYWSSSYNSKYNAYNLNISYAVATNVSNTRYQGFSVRLVSVH